MFLAFVGEHCEEQANPCFDEPCSHGDCLVTDEGGYWCSCFRGFTGKYCDVPVDLCAEMECHNGGTCIDTVLGAICICPFQFAGMIDKLICVVAPV